MTAKIIHLRVTPDVNAGQMLQDLAAEQPRAALAMGWDTDGNIFVKSSFASSSDALWLLEHVKLQLLTVEHL